MYSLDLIAGCPKQIKSNHEINHARTLYSMNSITLQNGITVSASGIFDSLGGCYAGFNLFDTRTIVSGSYALVGYYQTRGEAIRAAMVFVR